MVSVLIKQKIEFNTHLYAHIQCKRSPSYVIFMTTVERMSITSVGQLTPLSNDR